MFLNLFRAKIKIQINYYNRFVILDFSNRLLFLGLDSDFLLI
jgi:hypothetical protein